MEMEADQEFVEYIVKSIVDNPDDVKTKRTIDEQGVLITLQVNPEDMGKVIGKQGETAKAVRKLLQVMGAKHNARISFKILEPEGSERKEGGEKPAARIGRAPARPAGGKAPKAEAAPREEKKAKES
jgi:predicted RNA-binding protein YlqC (UPF0109 family)